MLLQYTEKGKGNVTLVFLHYFGGASSTWDAVINILQNDFRCIAVDLLGFGNSPAPVKYPLSVNDSSDAVIQLIEHLHLSNYILIGHSMGGKIVLSVAANQPEGLEKLILIAPSPPTPEPMSDKEREDMTGAYGKKGAVEKMIHTVTAHPLPKNIFETEVKNNLKVSAIAWRSWPQHGSKENIAGRMKTVTAPLAIICGDTDKKFTKDFLQDEFSKYLQNIEVHEIINAGHLLPVETPAAVADLIRRLSYVSTIEATIFSDR